MGAIIPLVGILTPFVFVLVMVRMILAHKERRRQEAREVTSDVTTDAELAALAERMEKRIDALEQILDAEAPGWRKKYEHS